MGISQSPDGLGDRHSVVVAATVVALGSTDTTQIARYCGLEPDLILGCLAHLREIGIISEDGLIKSSHAAHVPPEVLGQIHGVIAEDLLSNGLDRVHEALLHARQAVDCDAGGQLVARLEGAAAYALASGRLADAQHLLEVAEEADRDNEPLRRVRRLELLAEALDGQGLVLPAKDVRARAFEIAEFSGQHDRLWSLATAHALPCDWFEGDYRSSALLVRAGALTTDPLASAVVSAARAIVSMRIPAVPSGSPQVAWVTRPSLAQPLADTSVEATQGSTGIERLLALVAWRTTHRSPKHLQRRRQVTAEAIDTAQILHRSDLLVEMALFRAVDGWESADYSMADQAGALARWASEASGNPRLVWQTTMSDVGLSLMRLEREKAATQRGFGLAAAQQCDHPGAFSAEILFMFQEAMLDADTQQLAAIIVSDDSPLLAHPLARAGQAYAQAVSGRVEQARDNLARCLMTLDEEASMLLVLHLLSRCAVVLNETDPIDQMIRHLQPFASHVAVDAHGWWIAGPVACDLAELEFWRGDTDAAARHWATAKRIASLMDDRRSLHRLEVLRNEIDLRQPGLLEGHSTTVSNHRMAVQALSKRERDVLDMMLEGLTNREIAAELAFSVSTIRATTMSIYRRLGLDGRAAVIAALHDSVGSPEKTLRNALPDG